MTGVTLTAGYQASNPFMVADLTAVIHAKLVVSSSPAAVTWYLEYSDDLVDWFREVAEEDAGGGAVLMPIVIRTFADNAGTTLAVGTSNLAAQLTRQARFIRVQIASAGAVVATLVAPFGMNPATGA